jgi:hypothetical protein
MMAEWDKNLHIDEQWAEPLTLCPKCGGRLIFAHGVITYCENSWLRYTMHPTEEMRHKMCDYGTVNG